MALNKGNCPHCKQADIIHDNWNPDHLCRCPLCGWVGARQRAAIVREDDSSKHIPHRQYIRNGPTVPCPVIGCGKPMVPGAEMCGRCTRDLDNYFKYKKHKLPPPVAKDESGRWVKRVARI